MRDLLSIGTSRGCEMIGVGVGLGLSGYRLNGKFDPSIINGLQFWLDANDSTTLYTDSTLTTLAVSDGDPIGGWKDKSGNGRNTLQTDALQKPTLKTNFLNGKNVVQFGAASGFLSTTSTLTSGLFTIFIVRKYNVNTSYRGICYSGNGANSVSFQIGYYAPYSGEFIQDNGNTAFVLQNQFRTSGTAWGVTTYARDSLTSSTRLKGWLNGTVRADNYAGTGVYTNPQTNTITLGDTLDGYISEVLIYDSFLSTANRYSVENYLKAKWGTP